MAHTTEPLPPGLFRAPHVVADPYPTYARLRELGPIHRIGSPPQRGTWLIVGYEEGRAALADPRLSKDPSNAPDWLRDLTDVTSDLLFSDHMLGTDPPDHTRLRRLVSSTFTVRRINRLEPGIKRITLDLIDAMAPEGRANLVEDFAVPLPVTVICDLLGIPESERGDFRAWSNDAISGLSTDEGRRRQERGARALADYFAGLVERKRSAPADDLVSALIAARDADDLLNDRELVATLILLLIAGHETTVNLIATGMFALFRHPAQLRMLINRPGLVPVAVEELLRYEPPLARSSLRIALEDIEVAGVVIPAGSIVTVAINAAGRDPVAVGAPEELDITREDNRHLAFGHGIHFCLGAPLARLEARIAFQTLLDRLPDIALACPPEDVRWREHNGLLRGIAALPVVFTPPAFRSTD